MSFKDLGNKNAKPHVDTPAQAEARAAAVADLKAKADAKAAKAAADRAAEKAKAAGAKEPQGGPPKK
ncbi:MAG TPA: hypothetical protein VF841_17075 [Anaeromyxobacter sp.]